MYTAKRPHEHHAIYLRLVREIVDAAPGTHPYLDGINNRILTGELYQALKEARN